MCINEEEASAALMTKDLRLPCERGIKNAPLETLITVAHIYCICVSTRGRFGVREGCKEEFMHRSVCVCLSACLNTSMYSSVCVCAHSVSYRVHSD